MPTVVNIPSLGNLNVLNSPREPANGRSIIPVTMDFTNETQFDFDLASAYNNKTFADLQTLYIDNSANANDITVTVRSSGQTIPVAKNTAGYYTIFANAPPKFSVVSTSSAVKVYMAMMNWFVEPITWGGF